MEQKKKVTNAQLQRRMQNALVFVPRDKSYQGIYFSDKGLRLEVTKDAAVVSTGFHSHVFTNITNAGLSRPWLYTKRVIEIANKHLEDCKTEHGYSYHKLLEILRAKEDRSEFNICIYVDWWIFNCFQPLYSVGESDAEAFLVYEAYMHNLARNAVLLSEKNEDVTNRQFIERVIANQKEYLKDMEEDVIFHKKTDEQLAKENVEAVQEQELNKTMEEQNNG